MTVTVEFEIPDEQLQSVCQRAAGDLLRLPDPWRRGDEGGDVGNAICEAVLVALKALPIGDMVQAAAEQIAAEVVAEVLRAETAKVTKALVKARRAETVCAVDGLLGGATNE